MDKAINVPKRGLFFKKERKSIYSNDVFKNIILPNNPKQERDLKLNNERIRNEVYEMMENIHHLSTGDKMKLNRKNHSKDVESKKKKQQVVNIFAHSFKKLMKINNLKSKILVENPDLDYIQIGNVKINKELTLKKYMRSTTIQATKFYSNLIKRQKGKLNVEPTKLRNVKSAQNIFKDNEVFVSPFNREKSRVNSEEKQDIINKNEMSYKSQEFTPANKMNNSKSTVSFFLTGNLLYSNKHNKEISNKNEENIQTPNADDKLNNMYEEGKRVKENTKNLEHLAKTLKNTKSIDIVDKCFGEVKNVVSLNKEIEKYGMKRISSEILKRKKALNVIHGKENVEKECTAKNLLGGYTDKKTGHLPPQMGFGSGELLKKFDKLFKISDATVFKYRDIISNYCGYEYSEDKNILVEIDTNKVNRRNKSLKIETNQHRIASMTHKINFKNEKILKKIEDKQKYEMIKKSVMIHKEKIKKTRNEFLMKYGKINFN